MAKRFVDTRIHEEPWFRKLKPKLKCAVRFLFDKCDNAGVWVIDMETMSYFVGEEITLNELLKTVNSDKKNRLELLGEDKLFIPGFVNFQYGVLSESCNPHRPVLQLLKKHGLYERVCEGYLKGIYTLEEKEEEQDKEKDKEKEQAQRNGEKVKSVRPTRSEAITYLMQERNLDDFTAEGFADAWMDHFSSNGWRVGGRSPMLDWKASLRNWVRNDKKFNPQANGHAVPKSTKDHSDNQW